MKIHFDHVDKCDDDNTTLLRMFMQTPRVSDETIIYITISYFEKNADPCRFSFHTINPRNHHENSAYSSLTMVGRVALFKAISAGSVSVAGEVFLFIVATL